MAYEGKKNNNGKIKKPKSKETRVIGGKQYSTSSSLYKVMAISKNLSRKGLTERMNPQLSVDYVSQAILQTYGCSLASGVENKTDYSLIETQTDTEEIQNENIFDSNAYSNLKNKNIEALDKFPNKDDPFYDLDDGLTQKLQQERNRTMKRSEPDLVELVAALITLNA